MGRRKNIWTWCHSSEYVDADGYRESSVRLFTAEFDYGDTQGIRIRILLFNAQFLQIRAKSMAMGYLSLDFSGLTLDSGAHQILWARKDVNRAIADLRGMLNFQLRDGRIPEMINWKAEKQGWIAHFLTRIQYSHTTYNDLTQMPVLPYSLRAIFEQTRDVEFLKEVVPKLVKYFNWWKTTRDVDGNGLVTILHPWESGIDLSPAYDPALGVPESNLPKPSPQTPPHLVRLLTCRIPGSTILETGIQSAYQTRPPIQLLPRLEPKIHPLPSSSSASKPLQSLVPRPRHRRQHSLLLRLGCSGRPSLTLRSRSRCILSLPTRPDGEGNYIEYV